MIRYLKLYFLFILLLFISVSYVNSKDFYKWTDEKGKVHYTTNPGSIPKNKVESSESFKGSKTQVTDDYEQYNIKDNYDQNSANNSQDLVDGFIINEVNSSFIRRIGFNKSLMQLYVEIENIVYSEKLRHLEMLIEKNSGENRKYLSQQEISRYNFQIKNLQNGITNYYDQLKLLEILIKKNSGYNTRYLSQQEISRNDFNIKKLEARIANNKNRQKTIKKYIYYDVTETIYIAFLNADSKGKFYNENVKGYYESKRIN